MIVVYNGDFCTFGINGLKPELDPNPSVYTLSFGRYDGFDPSIVCRHYWEIADRGEDITIYAARLRSFGFMQHPLIGYRWERYLFSEVQSKSRLRKRATDLGIQATLVIENLGNTDVPRSARDEDARVVAWDDRYLAAAERAVREGSLLCERVLL